MIQIQEAENSRVSAHPCPLGPQGGFFGSAPSESANAYFLAADFDTSGFAGTEIVVLEEWNLSGSDVGSAGLLQD